MLCHVSCSMFSPVPYVLCAKRYNVQKGPVLSTDYTYLRERLRGTTVDTSNRNDIWHKGTCGIIQCSNSVNTHTRKCTSSNNARNILNFTTAGINIDLCIIPVGYQETCIILHLTQAWHILWAQTSVSADIFRPKQKNDRERCKLSEVYVNYNQMRSKSMPF